MGMWAGIAELEGDLGVIPTRRERFGGGPEGLEGGEIYEG